MQSLAHGPSGLNLKLDPLQAVGEVGAALGAGAKSGLVEHGGCWEGGLCRSIMYEN